MKQDKVKYDFKAFGQAIKEARKAKEISRNRLADKLNIAPRYIASIENSKQHPSLQIFYELVTFLDVSVDRFFFPSEETDKSTGRRQLADAVTKGQHEYVLTTHIDKGHIHNHIIFCAANFVDHHKYVSNRRTYYGIRNMSDK